jgi:hypothetical protein
MPLGIRNLDTDQCDSNSSESSSSILRSGNLNSTQSCTRSAAIGTSADHGKSHNGPMLAQVHGISNSIFCSRCSMKGHRNQSCTNQIRCRSCYNYGHIAAKCLSRLRSKRYSLRIKSYTSIYAGEKSISTSSPLSQSDRSISHVSESPLNPIPA